MRNLLALLAFIALTVGCVGWYLNWYRVENVPSSPGHQGYKVDIDGAKIKDDLYKGEEKLHDSLEKNRKEGEATPPSPKIDLNNPNVDG